MMKMLRQLVIASLILSVANSCKKSTDAIATTPTTPPVITPVTIAPPPAFGFYVVGYFPSYRVLTDVPDVKFRMCNVINYAFAKITPSGNLDLGTNGPHLASVKTKAKLNGAKVFISVSGIEADFKTMAAGANGRTSFINQIMNLVRTYGLDGVDMDWEFPRTSDGTDITYTALMKQLSDSCHTGSKYYLTAAITAGKYAGAVRDGISSELWVGNYVDWFNIMSYDDFNTTVPYQHHTNLALSNVSMNYWVGTRSMPASKAVLGIAGYGRPSGMTQIGTILSFSNIVAQQASNAFTDSAIVSNGSFLNYSIYYNGIPTVKKKAMLAKQMGNGIMIWEKSQDAHDNNSLLKAVCDTIGRAY
jgi:chitinase